MEKRKVFAVIMSAILALSLTACGAVTVTTAQSEPQPAAEVETPTPTPVEEPEVTPEPTKEPEVEEVVEEPATEEPATEEVATEESEVPAVEVTPMDALLNSNMSEYISDGVFDVEKFAQDTGAPFWFVGSNDDGSGGCLALIYGNWLIQSGNGDKHPETSYVAIGVWDETDSERANSLTYSYIFPHEEAIGIGEGISVPVECVIHLQDVFDSTSKNGPEVAPEVVGTDFKPCDPIDETIQY